MGEIDSKAINTVSNETMSRFVGGEIERRESSAYGAICDSWIPFPRYECSADM
jgi:hypothetical protein